MLQLRAQLVHKACAVCTDSRPTTHQSKLSKCMHTALPAKQKKHAVALVQGHSQLCAQRYTQAVAAVSCNAASATSDPSEKLWHHTSTHIIAKFRPKYEFDHVQVNPMHPSCTSTCPTATASCCGSTRYALKQFALLNLVPPAQCTVPLLYTNEARLHHTTAVATCSNRHTIPGALQALLLLAAAVLHDVASGTSHSSCQPARSIRCSHCCCCCCCPTSAFKRQLASSQGSCYAALQPLHVSDAACNGASRSAALRCN